jgi:hypothetical protein
MPQRKCKADIFLRYLKARTTCGWGLCHPDGNGGKVLPPAAASTRSTTTLAQGTRAFLDEANDLGLQDRSTGAGGEAEHGSTLASARSRAHTGPSVVCRPHADALPDSVHFATAPRRIVTTGTRDEEGERDARDTMVDTMVHQKLDLGGGDRPSVYRRAVRGRSRHGVQRCRSLCYGVQGVHFLPCRACRRGGATVPDRARGCEATARCRARRRHLGVPRGAVPPPAPRRAPRLPLQWGRSRCVCSAGGE